MEAVYLVRVHSASEAADIKSIVSKASMKSPGIQARDLQDAFIVLLFTLGYDYNEKKKSFSNDGEHNSEYLKDVVSNWNESLKKAKVEKLPLKKVLGFDHFDHGRRVKGKRMENPIIVAKVGTSFSILDGSHRLLSKKDAGAKDISCLVMELPYDSILNME